MANANTILRIAKFPLSLLLIALSIVIFYFTADAFRNIGRDYPATVNDASRYVWKEGVTWDDFIHKRYHTVNLHYDWTNENLMWIVGGSCIIAGVLSLADAVVQQWRTMKGSSKTNAVDPLASTTLLFTVVALLASFITAIYIPTNNRKHELSTCYWSLGRTPDATFTCTRETMICGDVAATIANTGVNLLKNRELCGELRMTRHITIPLTIIAAALMVVYAVQMRLARKTDDTQASADERIARLQDDEE